MMRTFCALTLTVLMAASGGARATMQPSDPPPGFQLGDSVTMPTRAVSGAHESVVAFELDQKDLLPDCIAFDARDGAFYLGSARNGNVVRVDDKGKAREFVALGRWQVFGMQVDTERRWLWVCGFDGFAGGVLVFDLDTGDRVDRWVLTAPPLAGQSDAHGFTGLALTRANNAFLAHAGPAPAIYLIQNKQKPELFVKLTGLTDVSGITISPDETTLFVSGHEGVQAIDIATRRARPIEAPEGTDMGGIDGLCHHKGGLLGIRGNSIDWYQLDDARTRVTMTYVLEQNHPRMNDPAGGVIAGDHFYYLAGRTEPVILKLPLP